jgi:hypothetical protein
MQPPSRMMTMARKRAWMLSLTMAVGELPFEASGVRRFRNLVLFITLLPKQKRSPKLIFLPKERDEGSVKIISCGGRHLTNVLAIRTRQAASDRPINLLFTVNISPPRWNQRMSFDIF